MSLEGVQKPYVKLDITNNLSRGCVEKSFRRDLRIGQLKSKLELITGCDWQHVRLELFNSDGTAVMSLADDSLMLGAYPVEDGMRLHCIDDTKRFGEYESPGPDEEPVLCGFELTEEEYDRRPNTFRRWLKERKLGRFREKDPEEELRLLEQHDKEMAAEAALAGMMHRGDRCEVALSRKEMQLPTDKACCGYGTARGTVKFVGEIGNHKGHWVGVQLDEPFGVCDGSAEGQKYFNCDAKFGIFVKPFVVNVGDYPELGIEDLDEI